MVKSMGELGRAISHPAVPAAPPAIQPTQNSLKRSGAAQGPSTTAITPKVQPAASAPSMPSQIETDVPMRPPPKTITTTPAIAPNRRRFRRGGGLLLLAGHYLRDLRSTNTLRHQRLGTSLQAPS